jgi:hypothetical protein
MRRRCRSCAVSTELSAGRNRFSRSDRARALFLMEISDEVLQNNERDDSILQSNIKKWAAHQKR